MRTTGDLTKMDPKVEQQKRLDSLEHADMGMFTKDDCNYDVINFENYHHYNVTITSRGRVRHSCDCADYQNRCKYLGIKCKHILFVELTKDDYKRRSLEAIEQVNKILFGGKL